MIREQNRPDLVRLANWESEAGEAAEKKTVRTFPVVTGMPLPALVSSLFYIMRDHSKI